MATNLKVVVAPSIVSNVVMIPGPLSQCRAGRFCVYSSAFSPSIIYHYHIRFFNCLVESRCLGLFFIILFCLRKCSSITVHYRAAEVLQLVSSTAQDSQKNDSPFKKLTYDVFCFLFGLLFPFCSRRHLLYFLEKQKLSSLAGFWLNELISSTWNIILFSPLQQGSCNLSVHCTTK